jgi:hypothetical protein
LLGGHANDLILIAKYFSKHILSFSRHLILARIAVRNGQWMMDGGGRFGGALPGLGRPSSRGLEHSKTLRVHVGNEIARRRFGVRQPAAAFSGGRPSWGKGNQGGNHGKQAGETAKNPKTIENCQKQGFLRSI